MGTFSQKISAIAAGAMIALGAPTAPGQNTDTPGPDRSSRKNPAAPPTEKRTLELYSHPESAALENHPAYLIGKALIAERGVLNWPEYARALASNGDSAAWSVLEEMVEPAGNWDRARAAAEVVINGGAHSPLPGGLLKKAHSILDGNLSGSVIVQPNLGGDAVLEIDLSKYKNPVALSVAVEVTPYSEGATPVSGPMPEGFSHQLELNNFSSPAPFRMILYSYASKFLNTACDAVDFSISVSVSSGDDYGRSKLHYRLHPTTGQDPDQHLYFKQEPTALRATELLMSRYRMADKLLTLKEQAEQRAAEAVKGTNAAASEATLEGAQRGSIFPAFTVTGADNRSIELGRELFAGRSHTVLAIGFPRCSACIFGSPALRELSNDPSIGVIRLEARIGFSEPAEGFAQAEKVAAGLSNSELRESLHALPTFILPKDAEKSLSIEAFPTYIIVDNTGAITGTFVGGRLTPEQVRGNTTAPATR